eukprot:g11231.t1
MVCRTMGGQESVPAANDTVHVSTVPPLPAGWKQLVDPKSGHFYYGHTETGHVQWERPTGPPQVKQVRAPTQAERAAAAQGQQAQQGQAAASAAQTQPQTQPAQTQQAARAASQPATLQQAQAKPAEAKQQVSAAAAAESEEGGFWSGVGTVLSYVPLVNLVVAAPQQPAQPLDPAASGVWTHLVEYTLLWLEDGRVLAWNKDDVMALVLAIPRKHFKEHVTHVARAEKEARKQAIAKSASLVEVETVAMGARLEELGTELNLAKQLLAVDPRLAKLRHYLVPRHVPEEVFWTEYFKEVKLRIGEAVKGKPVKDILSSRKAHFVTLNAQAEKLGGPVDVAPAKAAAPKTATVQTATPVQQSTQRIPVGLAVKP